MPRGSTTLRLILGPMLCGLLLAASGIGEPTPAAAFSIGGPGRMGAFGLPAFGGGPRIAPRRGGGKVVGQPSADRGYPPRGDGRKPPIIGHGIGRDLGPPPPEQQGVGGGFNNGSGVPPRGERRFVADEVITEIASNATPQAIDQIARRYDLTRLESQSFPLLGSTFYRWRIGGRRSVADVVGAIEDERAVIASAQPNYIFTLQEDAAKSPAAAPGDAAQYVLDKLQIEQAHHLALGKSIAVVAIDSEIDAAHPDLDGSVVKSFDALGGDEKPQQHGTAIAGAIAAHKTLLGVAPGARLLAARAFADAPGGASGSSFAIYKSIEWAADNGARVVNMSFSGPFDPAMHRMLTAAYEKDLVLVAAAGNAGPSSPPLYPAADASVIAVTATDSRDGLFKMANRGRYIAVAAPGVEVLALAPGVSYQVTTGTSVAAAHVSGVVALLLERKPSLKPRDIRAILTTTAKPLGTADDRSDFGSGLVNAYRAVILLNDKPSGQSDGGQAKQ